MERPFTLAPPHVMIQRLGGAELLWRLRDIGEARESVPNTAATEGIGVGPARAAQGNAIASASARTPRRVTPLSTQLPRFPLGLHRGLRRPP